jgi:hypothetical protein
LQIEVRSHGIETDQAIKDAAAAVIKAAQPHASEIGSVAAVDLKELEAPSIQLAGIRTTGDRALVGQGWKADDEISIGPVEAGSEVKKLTGVLAPLVPLSDVVAGGDINIEVVVQRLILEHASNARKRWVGLSTFKMPTAFSRRAFSECILLGLIKAFQSENSVSQFVGLVDIAEAQGVPWCRLTTPSSYFTDVACNTTQTIVNRSLHATDRSAAKEGTRRDMMTMAADYNVSFELSSRTIDLVEIRLDSRSKTASIHSIPNEALSTEVQDYPSRLSSTSEILRYAASLANAGPVAIMGDPFYAQGYAWAKFCAYFLDHKGFDLGRFRVNESDIEEWDYVNTEFDYEVWGRKEVDRN